MVEVLPHKRAVAGGRIPLVYVEPVAGGSQSGSARHLCIWQPGFSGAKEAVLPRLRELAAAGFVALCFDAPDHGERLVDGDAAGLGKRVRSNLRKYFWYVRRTAAVGQRCRLGLTWQRGPVVLIQILVCAICRA